MATTKQEEMDPVAEGGEEEDMGKRKRKSSRERSLKRAEEDNASTLKETSPKHKGRIPEDADDTERAGNDSDDEEDGDKRPLFIKYINGFAKLFGLVTIAILLWAAVDTIKDIHNELVPIEAYLIALCVLVILFEGLWYLDCLVCCQRNGTCCKVWSMLLWVDSWKKGILYVGLSVPCFAIDRTVVLAVVGGSLLVVTAFLYLCVAFQHCACFQTPFHAPPIVGHIERQTEDLRAALVSHDENETPNEAATQTTNYDSTGTRKSKEPPATVTEVGEGPESDFYDAEDLSQLK